MADKIDSVMLRLLMAKTVKSSVIPMRNVYWSVGSSQDISESYLICPEIYYKIFHT